jgi:hypothetical protein
MLLACFIDAGSGNQDVTVFVVLFLTLILVGAFSFLHPHRLSFPFRTFSLVRLLAILGVITSFAKVETLLF